MRSSVGPHRISTPLGDAVLTSKELQELVHRWGRQWDVPDLADLVTVEFSHRMRRSLGRCQPAIGRVRLASFLQEGPPEILEEVLCHELAHVAVRKRLGARAKAHGAEWSDLVRLAGFEPLTRAPASLVREMDAPRRRKTSPPDSTRYEHRCPVCHTVRAARRPVPSWHCAECLDAGLAGTMVISRIPPQRLHRP